MAKDMPHSTAPGSKIPRLVKPQSNGHRKNAPPPSKFEELAKNYRRMLENEKIEKKILNRLRLLESQGQNNFNKDFNRYMKNDEVHINQQNANVREPISRPPLAPHPPSAPLSKNGYVKRSAGRDRACPLPPVNVRRNSMGSVQSVASVSTNPPNNSPSPVPFSQKPKLTKPQVGRIIDSEDKRIVHGEHVGTRTLAKGKDKWISKAKAKYNTYVDESDISTPPLGRRKPSSFRKWSEEQRLRENKSEQESSPSDDYRPSSSENGDSARTLSSKNDTEIFGKPPIPSPHSRQEQNLMREKQKILQRQNSLPPPDISERKSSSRLSNDAASFREKERELEEQLTLKMKELEMIQVENKREEEKRKKAEEQSRKKKAILRQQQRLVTEAEMEIDEIRNGFSPHTASPVDTPPPPPPKQPKSIKPITKKPHVVTEAEMEIDEIRDGFSPHTASPVDTPPPPPPKQPKSIKPITKKPPVVTQPKTPELNEHTAFYMSLDMDGVVPEGDIERRQCHICGRKFNLDVFAKHEKICQKNSRKKPRKVFNMSKQRTDGTEMAQFVGVAAKAETPKPKKSSWRTQHENFISSMRYAKQVSKAEAAGGNALKNLPPQPPTNNPDYVQCPHCERRFNEAAADRHIPWCKEIKLRKKFKTQPRKP